MTKYNTFVYNHVKAGFQRHNKLFEVTVLITNVLPQNIFLLNSEAFSYSWTIQKELLIYILVNNNNKNFYVIDIPTSLWTDGLEATQLSTADFICNQSQRPLT